MVASGKLSGNRVLDGVQAICECGIREWDGSDGEGLRGEEGQVNVAWGERRFRLDQHPTVF